MVAKTSTPSGPSGFRKDDGRGTCACCRQASRQADKPAAPAVAKTARGKDKRRRVNLDDDNVLMAVNVFLDVGRQVHRRSKFKRAMEYFDTAVDLDPDSLKPLEPRAATLVTLAYFAEALEEIDKLEAAYREDAEDDEEQDTVPAVPLSVRRLKVEALWQGGHFERAAVLAARGMRVRRQPPYFTDMYYTSLGTLDQCLGASLDSCLEALADDGELLERLRPDPVSDDPQPVRTRHYVKPKTKEELCRDQRYKEFTRQRRLYKAGVFLGALGRDIEYIDQLVEHEALAASNRPSEAWIRRHVDAVANDMTKRMGYMEVECPLYAIRHREEVRVSSELRERREAELAVRRTKAKEDATKAILRILSSQEKGDPRLFAQALDAARLFFENTTTRVLPTKGDYQALLYHLIGIAYLQWGMLAVTETEPEARARQKRQQIHTILQTGEGRDVMMIGAAMPFFDYVGSLRLAEHRLRKARSKLERLCITFEMAFCNSKLHRWEQSLNHSRKALAMAREVGHAVWAVVSAVELCKAELHLNTRIEAKTTIREAIELADALQDEYIMEMLHGIADALENPAILGEEDEDVSPQQRILRLMADDGLRSRCTELFARINALPPEYRMALRSRWQQGEAADVKAKASASATFFRA